MQATDERWVSEGGFYEALAEKNRPSERTREWAREGGFYEALAEKNRPTERANARRANGAAMPAGLAWLAQPAQSWGATTLGVDVSRDAIAIQPSIGF